MTSPSIPIRNVYVMMAYAFHAMRQENHALIAAESFDHIHDLFAEILARGVSTQIKRGLHHDYRTVREELSAVRGRIDISGSIATRSKVRGRLLCEFDEYVPDTPHNQALKSVIILLIRHGQVTAPRKDSLRRLLPYLEAVTTVEASTIRWKSLTYHRANATYRLLLGACELVVRGLLPSEHAGRTKLASWVSDEAMSNLYERFLREYYAVHHPELTPRASAVVWDYDMETALGSEHLPAMRTDVTLRRGDRTLIIDAKFYSQSLQTGRSGKQTVHSAHLYQMLAYTNNADTDRSGLVSGMLLYARTEAPQQPDLDVVIQSNRIGARTLDLNRAWEHLREQLEDIVTWLEN